MWVLRWPRSAKEGARRNDIAKDSQAARGVVMRTGLAVLASAFVCGFATTASAQSINSMINRVEGMMHSAVAKAAHYEWNKLPKDDLACVAQKLTERGDSIQPLARRRIFPSDSRVAEVRTQCVTSKASPSPIQAAAQAVSPAQDQTPIVAQPAPQSPQQQAPSEEEVKQSELITQLKRTIEKLQTDLAVSGVKIAELERTKAVAGTAVERAEQGRLDAENANRQSERARISDKTELDAVIAQLEADRVATTAENDRQQSSAYAGIVGLLGLVVALTLLLFMKQKSGVLQDETVESESKAIEFRLVRPVVQINGDSMQDTVIPAFPS
jgi:hypothetical protein